MIFFSFCLLILASCCSTSPVSDIDLRTYIKDIQSKTDETVKPCEDFGKYACAKIPTDSTIFVMPHMAKLIEKDLNNDLKPKTDDEKFIRTLYSSCKTGNDITKIFEQIDELKSVETWPVKKDFNKHEIARLFGYLATLDPGFLSVNFKDLGENNTITILIERQDTIPEKTLQSLLEKFGTSEDSVTILQDMTNFAQEKQFKTDNTEVNQNKLKNIAELKEAVPNFDWDTYFTIFTKEVDLDKDDFYKKPVQVLDLEELKRIVNLIEATDSKTVVNYIVWRFLSGLYDSSVCLNLVSYLYPPIAIYNIKDEHKNFYLKELEVFHHFEKIFNAIKPQLNNPESKRLHNFLTVKKNVYENYESFLTGKYVADLFRDYDFNESTMCKNIINVMHVISKHIVTTGESGNLFAFADFLMSAVTKHIIVGEQHSSILHSFATVNADLWKEAIEEDNLYLNQEISDDCLPYENKTENLRNVYYLESHSGYYIALHDYLNFVNENEAKFKKQTEILNDAGLTHAKAFMLALAHEKCVEYGIRNLNDDKLLWFFKHSKDFSDAWGCTPGDEMYKICDDSTFTFNLPK